MLTELETATKQHFMPTFINQIFRDSPILHRIFKDRKEGDFGLALPSFDGRSLVEPLEAAKAVDENSATQVGAYDGTDTWTSGSGEPVKGAIFDWKRYHAGVSIDNISIAMNQGVSRVLDLAAIKYASACKSLRNIIIADFFAATADGQKKMIGLQAIVAASGLVGTIDKAAQAWWRSNIDTAMVDRDLTWTLLNKMFYNTKKYGIGDRATIIVTSEGVLQDYENRLTKTVVTGGITEAATPTLKEGLYLTTPLGTRVIDGGFDAFYFKRIPMVAEFACPAKKLFYINENYIHWRVLKNFVSTGWTQKENITGKDIAENHVKGYGALTVNACIKHGMIEALNEA